MDSRSLTLLQVLIFLQENVKFSNDGESVVEGEDKE
jgi:hypothetical protein